MTYLLDTNAWISYLNSPDSPVRRRMEKCPPGHCVTCSVVKAELYYGAHNSARRDENLRLLSNLFQGMRSCLFDDAAAEIYGRIRADLARKGKPIGPYDFMIAAIALANDVTLVTHNTAEFGNVPGLVCEDWEF